MKKVLCAALLVPAVAFAADSGAKTGFYGRADVGAGMRTSGKILGTKTKKNINAPVASIGAGYQFNEFFRTDVNLQYRNINTKFKKNAATNLPALKGKSYALMVNGSVDMPTGTMFTPYATAGLGYGKLSTKDFNVGNVTYKVKSKTGLVWNAGLGVKTKLQDNIDLDLGYKFVNLGQIKGPKTKLKVQSNELTAGVIISF